VGLPLADPLIGLSAIGDVGRGREPGQAARTCFISCRLARSLDADEATVQEVFYAALLQHIGCVAHAHDTAPLDGGRNIEVNAVADETDFSRPTEVLNRFLVELSPEAGLMTRFGLMLPAQRLGRVLYRTSCEVAESTARRIGLSEGVQVAVRHLSEWYNGRGGFLGRKGDEIPLAARIVPAGFTAALFDTLAGPDAALAALRARAPRIFDPAVADAFGRTGREILAELAAIDLLHCLPGEEPQPAVVVPDGSIDEIAVAFGEAVDLKAPFTHGSARRAFELAETAGSALGLEDRLIAQTRRAAALRDIGKAAISNAVIEKAGPLTEIEWEAVRLHAYHTERVLSRSPSLVAEGALAGLHHERPDGHGYHRGLAGSSVPVGARIVAATDALVAMTQPRPYRAAMNLDQACEALERDAQNGGLDPEAARAVVAAAHGASGSIRRAHPAGLTDRQVEVLRLIAEGLSNREIATRLVVSPRTAEHHVQDIYLKIGTSSRAAAALFAVEHQLL
jgi:HD-GYP domain-containing protein (c-di-GMP phosphodiesterase class II)